jgi:hypothetical protein
MADFLIALAEFDRRCGWEALGHANLFSFARVELGLSRSGAYWRLSAARLVQRFPEVIAPLRDGQLSAGGPARTGLRALVGGNPARGRDPGCVREPGRGASPNVWTAASPTHPDLHSSSPRRGRAAHCRPAPAPLHGQPGVPSGAGAGQGRPLAHHPERHGRAGPPGRAPALAGEAGQGARAGEEAADHAGTGGSRASTVTAHATATLGKNQRLAPLSSKSCVARPEGRATDRATDRAGGDQPSLRPLTCRRISGRANVR